GVRAAGVVGHVDHVGDLGDRLLDHDLDPLGQRDAGHAAALTAAGEAQVRGFLLHGDEFGVATVGGDTGVDLRVEHLEHTLGHIAAQVGGRPAAAAAAGDPDSRTRAVGVVEDEAAFDRIA